jgi:two-component system response regulator YesN|nr:AraC family transcriptional regulator [uncultured Lachnoclostridium sp.]
MIYKFLQNLHQRSFLRRLFMYCLSVLSLLLVFLVINYVISSRELKEQIYGKVEKNLSFISDTIDTRIETVQKMALSFFNSESVLEFYRIEEEQTTEIQAEQYRVCKVLTQNESLFSDFVKRYYAFYSLSDKVYSGAGVYSKDFYFNELFQYELYPEEYWKGEFKNNSFRLLQPSEVYSNTYGTMGEVLPIVYAKNIRGKQVVFIADVSCEKIREILDCATILNGINVLILQDDQLLLQSSEVSYSTEGTEKLINSLSQNSGRNNLTIDNADYSVFHIKSEYSSLKFVALVPVIELNSMMYSNLYYILMLGVALIGSGILLSVFFSYRIYKPINTVISSISEETGDTIVDEVSYLQQSVENMVAENRSYNSKLKYYGESYVEHQMQLLINGIDIVKKEELLQILREHHGFLYDNYICTNILFNFTEKFYESFSTEQQDRITEKLSDILQTILDKKELCYVFQIQKGLFTCIVNYDGNRSLEEIKNSINELEVIFKEDIDFYHVQVGMDSYPCFIHKLNYSYNHAMVALRNCNPNNAFELKDYQQLSRKNKISFTFYDQKKIVNCITIGNKEKLLQLLNQLLDENIKRNIEYQDLKELFMQVYYVGQRCLEENKLEYTEMENMYAMIEVVKNLNREEDIIISKKNIMEFLTNVLELVNGQEQREEYGTVYKIKQYVEKNYALNLSLDSIADEFGLTAKYISKIYKIKTGENITDFIDKVRIQQSKQLLIHTNMKIGDIAVAVGIESRSTFFRIFRKLEGVSPNEYRIITTTQEDKESEDC